MAHRLEIDGWKSGIRFSACHMLLRHDKCSRLHGHSYCIHTRVHGNMDHNNMLVDFGCIKRELRKIASEMDHMTLVPTENPDIEITRDDQKDSVKVDMIGKKYMFPLSDVRFLPIQTTTVEEMSRYFLERLMETLALPSNIEMIEIGVDEGVGQGAWSKYVTGD